MLARNPACVTVQKSGNVSNFHRVFNLGAGLGVHDDWHFSFQRGNFQLWQAQLHQIKRGGNLRGQTMREFSLPPGFQHQPQCVHFFSHAAKGCNSCAIKYCGQTNSFRASTGSISRPFISACRFAPGGQFPLRLMPVFFRWFYRFNQALRLLP